MIENYVQGVSENLISVRNLLTWPIIVQMISIFNNMCSIFFTRK